MPERTLPLPTGAKTSSRAKARRNRRRLPTGGIVTIFIVALAAAGVWAWWNGSVGSVAIRPHCSAIESGKVAGLDPEQAGNAALITSIATRRGLPARAASIAIATALQESKLRNIQYGDRDSLGLFQQRPSQGWGTRTQILDPVHAANAFYDALVKVKGYEGMAITEVAQKVQRSAFPTAYADHEPEARLIASAISGYSAGGFNCVLRPSSAKPQAVGSGGLTARAAALRTAASRETGRTSPAVLTGGRTLRFSVPVQSNNRAAWALGSWAVARADGLTVSRVVVGNQLWDRKHSTDGWTTSASAALPRGAVVIEVS
jgi:hypothetical protein